MNALLDSGCGALGVNCSPNLETILVLNAQRKRKGKVAGIKTTPYKYFAFEDYAIEKGYLKKIECRNDVDTLLKLTSEGLRLTDNVFLPYTPVGLWKEIWKEHKVFFTLLPTLATVVTGTGLIQTVRWIADKLIG